MVLTNGLKNLNIESQVAKIIQKSSSPPLHRNNSSLLVLPLLGTAFLGLWSRLINDALPLGLPFLVWVLLSLTGSSMMLSALKSTWTCQAAKYVQNSSSPPLLSTKSPFYFLSFLGLPFFVSGAGSPILLAPLSST